MSWLSRITNIVRRSRLDRELEEELAGHLEEAGERGRSTEDVRRAFGSILHHRESSRDLKLLPWLDSLISDIVFGWRQLLKRRAASLAAVLSLGLAIGSTTAVYRLVEALLLHPLPIANPERFVYLATSYITRDGLPSRLEEFDYPTYRKYRDLTAGVADLLVVGINTSRATVQIGDEPEPAHRQFVSGNVFPAFGLNPAVGRLLSPDDDRTPGAHPVMVLSHDYWLRRFAGDPAVVGRTLRVGPDRYTIIGVAPKGFTGTEPGAVTDIFLPAMMNVQAIESPGWSWFRIWALPKPGVSPEQLRQVLQAYFANQRREAVKSLRADTPRQTIDNMLNERILIFPAANGASNLQEAYRRPLGILGGLVVLVLLVACANVGNLLTAQAAARSREMALRVSIGAGRMRLVQLVLVESAMLAVAGCAVGIVFAGWSAPWIVSILRVPQDPVRFVFDTGWRFWAFNGGLAMAVTLLFGIPPALRASAAQPMAAMKGGADPHARGRLMKTLLAAQIAFCVLVQFVAGLFVATFDRLANRDLGFAPEHIQILSTSASGSERSPAEWQQVAAYIRQTPGVESVALAGWPLIEGNRWTMGVRLPGRAGEARPAYALDVSPGFFETMRMKLVAGRDIRPGDLQPVGSPQKTISAGVGVVNEAFVRTFFEGQSPLGRWIDLPNTRMEIVGVVSDAVYANVREVIKPTIYVPQKSRGSNSILVRTAGPPAALTQILRARVPEARSDYRVRTVEYQTGFVQWNLLRERLLALLSLFFAAVALLLAAVGLYGVLNYSVTQQRREIGIRMALGARAAHVVRRVTSRSLGIVALGTAVGLAAGLPAARIVESVLYDVKPTDWDAMALPAVTLLVAALLAAAPPALRAVRIDPARTLRSE